MSKRKKISESNTPLVFALIVQAANYRKNAAFGDGSFLEGIMEIITKLMPFIMGCFPAKGLLVEAVEEITGTQRWLLYRKALKEARRTGLKRRDRRAAATEAVSSLIATASNMSAEELEACYDELGA